MSAPVTDRPLKAIAHVCTAFFLFTLMQALNKFLTGAHDVVEIAFYRNLIALLPCLGFLIVTRHWDFVLTRRPRLMALRVLVGTVGLILTFSATQLLPLANATVIFFAATLMVPVMAHFFLKEHIGIYRWIAVGIGMSGVLLVAQPTLEMTVLGLCVALGAAFCHGSMQILIRTMKAENPFTITFYFFLGGVVFPGLAMPWIAHMPSYESALILLGIGITGGLGQYFATTGFQMAPASLLSPFGYTGLLWATLFDVVIWNFVPGWPVYLGATLIIGSKLFILYREQRQEKAKKLHSAAAAPQI